MSTAFKLKQILLRARAKAADEDPIWKVWCIGTQTEPSKREGLRANYKMLTMFDHIRKVMASNIEWTEAYSKPFIDLEYLLTTINLETNWGGKKGRLSSEALLALDSLHLLAGKNEKQITDEQITKLKTSLLDLYLEVKESNLPTDVRELILQHLTQMAQAILDFEIFQDNRIIETTKAGYTNYIAILASHPEIKEEPRVRKYVEKLEELNTLFEGLRNITQAVQLGWNTAQPFVTAILDKVT